MSTKTKPPMPKKDMHKPEYQPVLRDLYARLLEKIERRDQWNNIEGGFEYAFRALGYQAEAECLLELLENVCVFSTGGGAKKEFCTSFDHRVKSFAFLAEEAS